MQAFRRIGQGLASLYQPPIRSEYISLEHEDERRSFVVAVLQAADIIGDAFGLKIGLLFKLLQAQEVFVVLWDRVHFIDHLAYPWHVVGGVQGGIRVDEENGYVDIRAFFGRQALKNACD